MRPEVSPVWIGIDRRNPDRGGQRRRYVTLVHEGLQGQLQSDGFKYLQGPYVNSTDHGIGFDAPSIGDDARHASPIHDEVGDHAALPDLHAQGAATVRQGRKVVIRFAVAPQGIEEPDQLSGQRQVRPGRGHLGLVHDRVFHAQAIVQGQQPFPFRPARRVEQVQATHVLEPIAIQFPGQFPEPGQADLAGPDAGFRPKQSRNDPGGPAAGAVSHTTLLDDCDASVRLAGEMVGRAETGHPPADDDGPSGHGSVLQCVLYVLTRDGKMGSMPGNLPVPEQQQLR